MNAGVWIFIVGILVVIMVHESGHFLVAKLFGFKATRFFLGFGPTLWSFQKGETEYGVKAIPAGGFVKIIGMSPYEEIAPEDEPRSYPNKPAWQRALLLLAGSATHWVVAFVILLVTAITLGFPGDDVNTVVSFVQQRTDGVTTAAAEGGFQVGDRFVAVGGRPVGEWAEIVEYIQARPNETGEFTIVRDGREMTIEVAINPAIFDGRELVEATEPGGELREPRRGERVAGFLGVSPERIVDRYGPIEGTTFALTTIGDFTVRAVTSLPEIFRPVFNGELWASLSEEGDRGPEGAVGVVGAGRLAGAAAEAGLYAQLLAFIAGFTIFIGIMNLLPLPPLDGGHLAVLLYEKLTGKAVDVRKLIPVAAAVIAFFLVLFAAVLYLDLVRPIKVPF